MKLTEHEYQQIKSALNNFQKEQHLEILIAALGGSCSIGTDNTTSDLDIYVIYRHLGNKIFPRKMYCQTTNMDEIHIVSCSEQEIICEIEAYGAETHVYPSYLHRTKEEMQKQQTLTMYERRDYPRTLVFYTLMADVVWTFDMSEEECYRQFRQGLAVSDVLDFYYTKAYGNYEHFIENQVSVLARKYITTIQEILYCRWICEKKTIPPMDVRDLLDTYMNTIPDELKSVIQNIYDTNRSTAEEKTKKEIASSKAMNQYIYEWLQLIKKEFSSLEHIYFPFKI